MAVPKHKISKSRRGLRRSHDAIAASSLSTCPNCQESKQPHRVCMKCGWYKDREVLTVDDE
ncbi:MAG: 50S ribosomal protein L32 [Magnetococcales bacterium]|nr:50S ribosomal protein L32 [Magnetococcales bacterium]